MTFPLRLAGWEMCWRLGSLHTLGILAAFAEFLPGKGFVKGRGREGEIHVGRIVVAGVEIGWSSQNQH